jgi:hypothetical protein
MNDVMARLRAANPVPNCPLPPIEEVWRQIDSGPRQQAGQRRAVAASRRFGRWLAAVASVALVVGVATLAVVEHDRGPRTASQSDSTTGGPRAARVDPQLGSMFSALRATRRPADALPAVDRQRLKTGGRTLGLDPAASRAVRASNGTRAYLVPGRDGMCAFSAVTAVCDATARLPGAFALDVCSPALAPGEIVLGWVLPDRARDVIVRFADGTPAHFSAGFNVYVTTFRARRSVPRSLAWQQDGQPHSIPVLPTGTAHDLVCTHPRRAR